jgi:hypothetical protein
MIDLSVAYHRYRFLGDEFLTWLWYLMETNQDAFRAADPDCLALEVGNRIVLENRKTKSVERVTIKGDDAGLEEGRLALRKGALVTDISLIFKTGEYVWNFSIKGENLSMSGLKTPGPALPQGPEDFESFLVEKSYQIDKIMNFIDIMFKSFIQSRVSAKWATSVMPAITRWVGSASPA